MLEFTCPEHGEFEELTDRRDGKALLRKCYCGADSPVVSSYAVMGKMKLGEVVQGKRHTNDLPPHVMRTEELADGMPHDEWRVKETKRINELTRPKKSRKIIVS